MEVCIPLNGKDEILEEECELIEIYSHQNNVAILEDIIGFKIKEINYSML